MILRPLCPHEAYKAAWIGYAVQFNIVDDELREWYLYFDVATSHYLLQFRVRWHPAPVLVFDRQRQADYLRGTPLIFDMSDPSDSDIRTIDSAQATRVIEGIPNRDYLQHIMSQSFPTINFIWGGHDGHSSLR